MITLSDPKPEVEFFRFGTRRPDPCGPPTPPLPAVIPVKLSPSVAIVPPRAKASL